MYKVLVVILLCFSTSIYTIGQYNEENRQYVLNPMSINPSFSGSSGALNIATFYGRQWTGIEGAPRSFTLSADAPFLNQKLGIGLMVINNKIGVTDENKFIANYAYRTHIGKNSILSFGLGGGIKLTNSSYSDLVVNDPGDDMYLQNGKNYILPNFNFGISYMYKSMYVGLSAPNLINYEYKSESEEYEPVYYFFNNVYLLNMGSIFKIGNQLKLYPSALLRYSEIPSAIKVQFDFNTYIGFRDVFWFGGVYRHERSVGALFQLNLSDQVGVAYTYNYEISRLQRYTNGSHEVMLRFTMKYLVNSLSPLNF